MHKFGSDVVLDLRQYFGFDYLGWVRGRVDARPEYVFCMVEGLPAESRYKTFTLPNPNNASDVEVEYQASLAHQNVLLSQLLLAWAGENAKTNDVMPPWGQTPDESKIDSGGSHLERLNAAFMRGLPANPTEL